MKLLINFNSFPFHQKKLLLPSQSSPHFPNSLDCDSSLCSTFTFLFTRHEVDCFVVVNTSASERVVKDDKRKEIK